MLGRARILEQGNIEDQGRDQGRERGKLNSPPHETSCHGGGAEFPSDPTKSLFSKILMNTIKSWEIFGNDL